MGFLSGSDAECIGPECQVASLLDYGLEMQLVPDYGEKRASDRYRSRLLRSAHKNVSLRLLYELSSHVCNAICHSPFRVFPLVYMHAVLSVSMVFLVSHCIDHWIDVGDPNLLKGGVELNLRFSRRVDLW